jgi:hypothetical protein
MLSSFYHLQPSNRDFIPSMIHQILRPKAEPVTLFRYQARVEADFFTKSIHSIHENSMKIPSKTQKPSKSTNHRSIFPGTEAVFGMLQKGDGNCQCPSDLWDHWFHGVMTRL